MKVFISWSGDLSHQVALNLRDWLPVVLPFIDAWVSSEDIPKGTRWSVELADELDSTYAGIICVVPGNRTEPWLNFEAGALSKSVETARIHPFLLGIEPGELPGPLAQFQATRFSKDDTRKLVHALNSDAREATLPTATVDRSFEFCWPTLERQLTPLLAVAQTDPIETAPDSRETQRDLTAEELKVLGAVANSHGLHPLEAQEIIPLHEQRIQHIMESLEDKGLLEQFLNHMGGHSWHLSKDGRAFLVKQGFL